jgi:hypothetical protein
MSPVSIYTYHDCPHPSSSTLHYHDHLGHNQLFSRFVISSSQLIPLDEEIVGI